MLELRTILAILGVALVTYYVATFCIWFGHWFSHLHVSPLRAFHVLGHHALYRNSTECRSKAFRYGSGRHDSTVAFLPWLFLAGLLEYALLPRWLFAVCVVETLAIMGLYVYVHEQFHLAEPALARFSWFGAARDRHDRHHDREMNFMVVDHFWDKVFRTYTDTGAKPES